MLGEIIGEGREMTAVAGAASSTTALAARARL
jgi:hypothetical protein